MFSFSSFNLQSKLLVFLLSSTYSLYILSVTATANPGSTITSSSPTTSVVSTHMANLTEVRTNTQTVVIETETSTNKPFTLHGIQSGKPTSMKTDSWPAATTTEPESSSFKSVSTGSMPTKTTDIPVTSQLTRLSEQTTTLLGTTLSTVPITTPLPVSTEGTNTPSSLETERSKSIYSTSMTTLPYFTDLIVQSRPSVSSTMMFAEVTKSQKRNVTESIYTPSSFVTERSESLYSANMTKLSTVTDSIVHSRQSVSSLTTTPLTSVSSTTKLTKYSEGGKTLIKTFTTTEKPRTRKPEYTTLKTKEKGKGENVKEPAKEKSSLSTSGVVGIVVGAMCIITLIGLVVNYSLRKCKKSESPGDKSLSSNGHAHHIADNFTIIANGKPDSMNGGLKTMNGMIHKMDVKTQVHNKIEIYSLDEPLYANTKL